MPEYLVDEQPLIVLPTLAAKLGLNAAVAIQQIHYWLKINEKARKQETHFFDGKWWCYNTYKQWHENNFKWWSIPTIQRIFYGLKERGLIECREYDGNNTKGNWVTINYDELEKVMGMDSSKGPHQNDEGSERSPHQNDEPPSSNPRPIQIISSDTNIQKGSTADASPPFFAPSGLPRKAMRRADASHRPPEQPSPPSQPDGPGALETLICHELKLPSLSATNRKKLTSEVRTTTANEGTAIYPSPEYHFAHTWGFPDFVAKRIEVNQAIARDKGTKVDLRMLLGDIRNYDRENTGWHAWKKAHVVDQQQESEPVTIGLAPPD